MRTNYVVLYCLKVIQNKPVALLLLTTQHTDGVLRKSKDTSSNIEATKQATRYSKRV